jgi:hypothetical protein
LAGHRRAFGGGVAGAGLGLVGIAGGRVAVGRIAALCARRLIARAAFALGRRGVVGRMGVASGRALGSRLIVGPARLSAFVPLGPGGIGRAVLSVLPGRRRCGAVGRGRLVGLGLRYCTLRALVVWLVALWLALPGGIVRPRSAASGAGLVFCLVGLGEPFVEPIEGLAGVGRGVDAPRLAPLAGALATLTRLLPAFAPRCPGRGLTTFAACVIGSRGVLLA